MVTELSQLKGVSGVRDQDIFDRASKTLPGIKGLDKESKPEEVVVDIFGSSKSDLQESFIYNNKGKMETEIKLMGQGNPEGQTEGLPGEKEEGYVAPEMKTTSGKELTEEDIQRIQELRKRDHEVKAHERAHVAAGAGAVKGGPSYIYVTGPDGRRYAVGGEVQIDTSEAASAQATIAKMNRIRAAAMAPANPSGQDRAVARFANSKISEARRELMESQMKKISNNNGAQLAIKKAYAKFAKNDVPDIETPDLASTATLRSDPYQDTVLDQFV